MVKNNKKRVMITLPKKQLEWLEGFCKNHNKTISKYISYMLAHKAEEMLLFLKIDEENIYTREELDEIIKTKWIDEDE